MPLTANSARSLEIKSFLWPSPPNDGSGIKLPSNILLFCHGIRIAVVVLLVWRLFQITRFSLDKAGVVDSLSRYDGIDITGVTNIQIFGLFVLNLIVLWALQVGIYMSLFQLFTGFIRGEVFSPKTGTRLRRAGLFTMCYIVAAPLRYVLALAVLTFHLPEGATWVAPNFFYVGPLYDFILGGTGVILGQVLKTGAEIAQENSEIV